MIPGTDLLYMGQGQKEKKGAAKGKRGAVYGNWRGPSTIRPKTDATAQFTLHF